MRKRRGLWIGLGLAGVLLVALVLNYLSFRRAHRVWSTTIPDSGALASVEGADLYYTLRGSGEPLIVVEMGLGTLSEQWDAFAEDLTAYGTVLQYERGGNGYSQTENYPRHAETISRELSQLLDAVDASGPVLYIGHSFGANQIVAHALNIDRPVIGLVMVDPAPMDYESIWMGLLEDERLGAKSQRVIRANVSNTTLFAFQAAGPSGLMYRLHLLQGGNANDQYYDVVMNASSSAYYDALKSEMDFAQNQYSDEDIAALGDLPIILIANNHDVVFAELAEDLGLPEAEARIIADALFEGKKAYAVLSEDFQFMEATTGEHSIHLFEPEILLAAVESIMAR